MENRRGGGGNISRQADGERQERMRAGSAVSEVFWRAFIELPAEERMAVIKRMVKDTGFIKDLIVILSEHRTKETLNILDEYFMTHNAKQD